MFKNVSGQKIQLFCFDTTTGAPKTGDAANITAYVSKDHGSATALTDTSATELDSTNAKGIYIFDLTQGETNGDELTFSAKSSTSNISITPRFISTNPANFTAASIDSNGRVDVIKLAGTTQTARDIGASVLLSSGTGTGQLDFTSGVVKANATQFAGQTITAASGVTMPATVASTTNITAGTITTVTNLTNAPTAGDFTATMKTSIGTAVAASAVASVTAGVTVTTNNDKTGYALTSAYDFAKGTVAMTESYAADGATATPAQLLYMLWSLMAEKSISSTTLTAKKLDGSTTAMTFTLNDATSPTSITRSS